MANITKIKCTNPDCGKQYELKCTPEEAVKLNFICRACKTRFSIKDAIVASPDPQKPPFEGPVKPLIYDHPVQNTGFNEGVAIFRESDGYPYLFFKGKTTFGRYDSTMQAEVPILTDDTTISRCHVRINVTPCEDSMLVSLTNLVEGRCKIHGKDLHMNETVQLNDGDFIKLGNTVFTIRDINKNDI